MISALSNISPYASLSSAILGNVVSTSSTVNTSSANQEALLEAELAIYTQELAAASSGDSSTVPGALNAQQLQAQIASIQQQIDQLNVVTYTATPLTSSPAAVGNIINIFA